MKSLLVDALRQASDRDRGLSPEDRINPDRVAVESVSNDGENSALDIDELELVEHDDLIDTHDGLVDSESVEPIAVSPQQSSPPGFIASHRQSSNAGAISVGDGERNTRSFERYAVWTPLVCLLLCTSAAGFYSVWNRLVGESANSDLQSLSTPSQTDTRADNGDTPIAEPVRFPFAPNRPTAKRIPIVDPSVVEPAMRISRQAESGRSKYEAFSFERVASSEVSLNKPSFTTLTAAYQSYRIGEISTAAFESILADRANQDAAATSSEIKLLLQRYADAAPLYFTLGNLYAKKADWAEARVAFEQANEIDGNNSTYLFNLAESLERLGRHEEAGRLYESATRLAKARRPIQ